MDWASGIVVFLIIWWTALFAVLPLWVKRNDGSIEGADPGAPQDPFLKRKILVTTLVSAAIWVIVYLLIHFEIISFFDIAERMFRADNNR
jgi:predicted secreted protein